MLVGESLKSAADAEKSSLQVDTENSDETQRKPKKPSKSKSAGVSMCKKSSQKPIKSSGPVQYDSDTDDSNDVQMSSKRRRLPIE